MKSLSSTAFRCAAGVLALIVAEGPSLAVDINGIGYEIKPGTLTPDGRKVKSPYAKDKKPFAYLDRIQPPPPAPPKYLVLDIYTDKYFWLPEIAPTIYHNGNRYSFAPAEDLLQQSFQDKGPSTQFSNLGAMFARYVPQALAPPIRSQGGDMDETTAYYDPSAPPEYLLTAGWQSADVYKDIDKTSEASLPVSGDPGGDKVRRTSIYYTKASAAYDGFAFTATYLESTDLLRPRAGSVTAIVAGERELRNELAIAAAGGPVGKNLLSAERLLGPSAFAAVERGNISQRSFDLLEKLFLRHAPSMTYYQEADFNLNYSHEIAPHFLENTIGYTAYYIPNVQFWGTGFAGESYDTLAITAIPHFRPSATFSLFNSAEEVLRGKFFDFKFETYGLTVFESPRFNARLELNPYIGVGVDDGLIGDGVDWTAVRFGVRAPVYLGKHAVLNMDLNYGIPINGHSDSTTNFRTDLSQVGVWGGASISFRF